MNRRIHCVTLKEISILGGNSSKVEISPCSSEEFFQHFPKRTTFSLAENGSYKPILKSPLQDLREANKNCPLYLDKEQRKGLATFPLKSPLSSPTLWTFCLHWSWLVAGGVNNVIFSRRHQLALSSASLK